MAVNNDRNIGTKKIKDTFRGILRVSPNNQSDSPTPSTPQTVSDSAGNEYPVRFASDRIEIDKSKVADCEVSSKLVLGTANVPVATPENRAILIGNGTNYEQKVVDTVLTDYLKRGENITELTNNAGYIKTGLNMGVLYFAGTPLVETDTTLMDMSYLDTNPTARAKMLGKWVGRWNCKWTTDPALKRSIYHPATPPASVNLADPTISIEDVPASYNPGSVVEKETIASYSELTLHGRYVHKLPAGSPNKYAYIPNENVFATFIDFYDKTTNTWVQGTDWSGHADLGQDSCTHEGALVTVYNLHDYFEVRYNGKTWTRIKSIFPAVDDYQPGHPIPEWSSKLGDSTSYKFGMADDPTNMIGKKFGNAAMHMYGKLGNVMNLATYLRIRYVYLPPA